MINLTEVKNLTEYDLLVIEAMKKHTLMLCVKVSSSGMSRKYKVMTVFTDHNGQSIVDCGYTLKKLGYTTDKDFLVKITGCGFSPICDLANDLGVQQSIIREEYI